jgi:hypothetical protein
MWEMTALVRSLDPTARQRKFPLRQYRFRLHWAAGSAFRLRLWPPSSSLLCSGYITLSSIEVAEAGGTQAVQKGTLLNGITTVSVDVGVATAVSTGPGTMHV